MRHWLFVAVLLALGAGGPALPPPSTPSPRESSAWLGLFLASSVDGGMEIVAVVPGSPASLAGLRKGDVILRVNGAEISGPSEFREAVGEARKNGFVVLAFLRDGRVAERTLRVEESAVGWPWDSDATPGSGKTGEAPEPEPAGVGGLRAISVPRELLAFFGVAGDAGLLVTEVEHGGTASVAGLRVGDVLLTAGGRKLRDESDLAVALVSGVAGAPVEVDVVRAKAKQRVVLTFARRAEAGAQEDQAVSERIRRIEEEIAKLEHERQELLRGIERRGGSRP